MERYVFGSSAAAAATAIGSVTIEESLVGYGIEEEVAERVEEA